MAESYSVTAILSAQDKNFSSVFGSAQGAADSLAGKLKSGLGFGVMQAIGMKAVNTVTGAIGGLVGGVMEVGSSFESSMAQVAATMGKPVSSIQNLSAFAREMGATTSFSATQAADALNYMALAGYDADKSMRVLPNVLSLAAAGNIDLARASDMVTDASSALGLTEQQTTDMVNQMAQAASKSNTSVSQLGDAFLTVGATARGLKGGTVELSTMLGVLADNGYKGAEGGTHLRNILLSLQSPTGDAAAALNQLGVSAYDADGNMRAMPDIIADMQSGLEGMDQASRDAIISGIFNKTDLAAVNALLGTEQDRFNELADSIENCGDAAKQMADTQLDNLEGDTKLLSSAMDELKLSIFENFNTPMRIAAKVATEAVGVITDKVKGLGDIFDGAFDLKEISNALEENGLAGAVSVLSKDIASIAPGFKSAAAAAGALGAVNIVNTVLDSGAWKASIAGIKSFGGAAKAIPGKLASGFANAGNSILNMTSRTFPGVLTGLSNVGDKAGGIFSKIAQTGASAWNGFTSDSVFGQIIGKFTGFAGKIGGVLGQVGGVILNTGGQLASGLQTMMGIAMKALLPAALIGAALAGLGVLYDKFGEQIDSILAMVQEKGPQVIQNFTSGITTRIPDLISKGSEMVSGLLNTIGALAPSLVSSGSQIIISLVQGVAANAPTLITSAVTAVGSFASSILAAIPSLLTAGMQLLVGVAQGVSANLPRMAQGAMQAIQTFAQNFMANLPTILTAAGQIVVSLVQGITAALPSLASGAVSIISTLATGFIQNLPQIIQTGVQVIASLALGIISGIGTLLGMIPQLFGELVNTIMSTDWLKVGSDIISAIGDGIMGAITGIGGPIGDAIGGVIDWVKGGEKAGTDYTTAASESITASAPQVTTAASTAAATVADSSATTFLYGGTQGGQNLMAGFATGIDANSGVMTTSATNAVTSATDILADSSVQSDADTAGQDLVASAASGIDSGASAAETAVQSTMSSALMAMTDGATDASAAGQQIGTSVIEGLTMGLEPIGETAQTAVQNMVSSMQSGLSSMQSAGQQAGARFAQGIRTGLTQAATAAKTSVKSITTALKSAVSPAQAAGRQAGTKFAAGVRAGMSAARSAGNAIGKNSVNGMKAVASSARSAGASVGAKFASGVSSKSGSAKSAGSSLAHAAKSGMSGVSTTSIGRNMGQGLVNGLNSKYGSVAAAARRLANAAAAAMRAAARVRSPSRVTKEIGGYMGEGLDIGIRSQETGAASAGRYLIKTVINAMRDEGEIHSPSKATSTIAGQLVAGFAKGLRENIAGVGTTAKQLIKIVSQTWGKNDFLRKSLIEINKWGTAAGTNIKNAVNKMKNAFGPGMKATGAEIASAFASEMKTKMKKISDSATGIISSATDKMVNDAKKQQERYQKAYEWCSKQQKEYEKKAKDKKASSSEKKAAEKKAKEYAALAKEYKATTEKYKNLVASYTKAGTAMKSAFSTAFDEKVNAAITKTTNAINKLAETYQAKYDAIIKARTEFRDKMREISLGEFDDEKKSVTALTDYNVAKRQVEQYGANLEKLKGILPSGMMNEILAMDTEEGLAYTEKLLSKGTSWLKEYAKSYNSFMSATTSVSNKYYQTQLDSLNTEYTKAVEAEFKKLETYMNTIGQQVMQGFADGMKSKKTALDNAGKALADSLIKTLKDKLKIHSPSKVAAGLGSYTGQGFVAGVEDQVGAARDAMQKLVEMPRPQLAMAAGAENLRLHDEYNYTSNRSYRFESVTELDGREIARSTAEYTEDELERRRKNSERIKGRR